MSSQRGGLARISLNILLVDESKTDSRLGREVGMCRAKGK